MVPKKLFPCAMGACLALSMLSIAVSAQTVETRHRQVAQNLELNDLPVVSDDPVIISLATDEEIKAAEALKSPSAVGFKFQQVMSAAIDQRLGARYVWGATGPSGFDCSGFVWSTFQSAGINFDRSSARTLWARFAPATEEEKFKFGTLVFFRGRSHIGIVADENGFYHASRHHGVVYSPFNNYWLSRIDGFRRVPLPVWVEAILD
jgi:cell wall-associated NlpC family hydrolase